MQRRRELLAMQSELPSAYQKVEYVQSDGASYIVTDILPSNTLGFSCTFYALSYVTPSDRQYGCIFGGRYRSGDNDFQLTTYTRSGSGHHGTFRFGEATGYSAEIIRNAVQSVSKRGNTFVNAAGLSTTISDYTWSAPRTISLFALNNNDMITQGGYGCRIYKMCFYDGNTLLREYIPCYRKSDNVIGMYEIKTKQFLTTPVGALTAGNPV